MARERSLRLRARVTLFFALIALFAGTMLIGVTYGFARNNLLTDRSESARLTAFQHAADAAILLDDANVDGLKVFFESELRTEPNGFALLRPRSDLAQSSGAEVDGTDAEPEVVPTNPRIDTELLRRATDLSIQLGDFPDRLITQVSRMGSGEQFMTFDGDPYVVVGVYVRRHDVGYFEAFPASNADTTLRALITALGLGGLGTLVLATLFGFSTSRRLLRPISRVADAAENIASGGLDTRLDSESDPDLDRLASSFNDMADAVQTRIEREARFASDVSHELRSPITALSAAVEVLDGRRDEVPERTRQALDVVVEQVRRFDSMVIDLLELSRLDAGATELNIERLDVVDLTRRVAARLGADDVPIDVAPRLRREIDVDKVRFDRILGNVIENAGHHGGGATKIELSNPRRNMVRIAVEDGGPGVASSERNRIFERYARGSAARHRVGTGLGLALVAEHSTALGGNAWVEDRPGGGARFVVELPVRQPNATRQDAS